MGYFPTPIAVKPLPDSDAIRISVRASEARIDEWTILRHDVESVLDGYDDEYTGWRGVGELRVRMGRSGGDVAFYDGDDRALLRLSISEVASFMAHLRACMYELEGSVRLPPPPSHRSAYASTSDSASASASGDFESLRGTMQQIMMAVITLTSDVNRMMRQIAEREAERAAQPAQVVVMAAPGAAGQAATPVARTVEDGEMFIPTMNPSGLTGASLEATEKSGSSDDLAAASAALKAAKKRRTKKKEEA